MEGKIQMCFCIEYITLQVNTLEKCEHLLIDIPAGLGSSLEG